MHITNDTDSPWYKAKVYEFGDVEVAVIKAQRNDSVKYYTELHRYGRYIASYGSNALTKYGAVWQAFRHKCPKEEQGYKCKHRPGECGSDHE